MLLLADYVHPFVHRSEFPQGMPAFDAVLAAGDLPGEFLEFLASSLSVPVVYVHGNHANESVHDDGGRVISPRGVVPAHGRVVEVAGLRVAGWGGCPRYRSGGTGQFTPGEVRWGLRKLAWQTRRGLDIFLTHAPPGGPHAGPDYAHRGCAEFNRFLRLRRPRLAVHGHVHEYDGKQADYTDEASGTRVINAYGYRLIEVAPPISPSR